MHSRDVLQARLAVWVAASVFCLFVVIALTAGLVFHIVTVALPKIVDERLGEVSLIIVGGLATLILALGALAQLAMGRLVEKYPLHLLFAAVALWQFIGVVWAAYATGVTILVALAVALNSVWVVFHWRQVAMLVFGVIFFVLIIAGLVLNTIFLVREIRRAAANRDRQQSQPAAKPAGTGEQRKDDVEVRRTQAIEMAVETFDALAAERGDTSKIWASMLKEAIKRRKPDFNESYYGFRAFGNLLDEAKKRGLLELGRDEKSGTYVFRSSGVAPNASDATIRQPAVAEAVAPQEKMPEKSESRRRGRGNRGGRKPADNKPETATVAAALTENESTTLAVSPVLQEPIAESAIEPEAAPALPTDETDGAKTPKKSAPRSRRPRKVAE